MNEPMYDTIRRVLCCKPRSNTTQTLCLPLFPPAYIAEDSCCSLHSSLFTVLLLPLPPPLCDWKQRAQPIHSPPASPPCFPNENGYKINCFSNAEVISGWRQRGKDKKDATNFGYTTLLPDNIPQSTNI